MPDNPRRFSARLAAAAVLLFLLLLVWFMRSGPRSQADDKRVTVESAANAPVAASAPQESGAARESRAPRGTAAANKLRSLLQVREGEAALIKLPAECVTSFVEAGATDTMTDSHVFFLGPKTPDWLEEQLAKGKGGDSRLEGQVKKLEELEVYKELRWSGDHWGVSVKILEDESSSTAMLQVTENGKDTKLTTVIVPHGEMLVLLSSSPNPEGLVIYFGGAARPAPGGGPATGSREPR